MPPKKLTNVKRSILKQILSYTKQKPIPVLSAIDFGEYVNHLNLYKTSFKNDDKIIQSIFDCLATLFKQSVCHYYQLSDMGNLFPLGDLLVEIENMFPNEHNQLVLRQYAYNVIMLNLEMVNQEMANHNLTSLDTLRNELAILKSHSLRIGFNECIPSIEASETQLQRIEMVTIARDKFFSTNSSLHPKPVNFSTLSTPTVTRHIAPPSGFNFFNLTTSGVSDNTNNRPNYGR